MDRHTSFGDKLFWVGYGAVASGVLGAILATTRGPIFVLLVSVAGALMVLAGAAAINHAEAHAEGRP